MAALSRSGAIIIVTVLSCAVLGAVWGAAIYLLPQSDTPSESIAITPVPHPLSQSSPFSPVQTPPRPDPAVPPVTVKDEPPVVRPVPPGNISSGPARMSFGMDLKCDMEIEALCSDDEGDRRACLQRKAGELPVPCQSVLRERLVRMRENMQQLRMACEADRKQFCRGVPLGGVAMRQCLESHAQEVSDQCFQFLPKRGRLLN